MLLKFFKLYMCGLAQLPQEDPVVLGTVLMMQFFQVHDQGWRAYILIYIYYAKESNAFMHISNLPAVIPAMSSSSWQSLASLSRPPANYESPGQSSHWNHSIWLLSHWVLSGFRFTCIHLIELKCRESRSTICLIVNNCKNPAFHFEMGHCMVEWSAAASVSSVGACSSWEQPQAHLLVFAMNLSGEEDTACASEAWYAIYAYII